MCPPLQDTLRNPTVMHFVDNSLEDTDFSTRDILNFLYSGPEEQREAGMPNFDWRNIFNIADQIIRMFNQYGEVRQTCCFALLLWLSHCLPNIYSQDSLVFSSFMRPTLSSPDRGIRLPRLPP